MFDNLKQGDRVRICWNVPAKHPKAAYVVASVNDSVITVLDEAGKAREFDRATGQCKESHEIWLETIPEA